MFYKSKPIHHKFCVFFLFVILSSLPFSLYGQESNCARVKIEVKQELTLERQAFEAVMKINNGLTHTPLEAIHVEVWFTDKDGKAVEVSSDPDNTTASFFIRISEMTGIGGVSGNGRIPAGASSEIRWLIIPAPGAAHGMEDGTLYNVGASLSYTLAGDRNTMDVSPDYIFVKPMPELTLDYFLPDQVYGDDPFTTDIEPPVPFTLGLRIKNNGNGNAHELKIDSAHPRIVDNDQGLPINFTLEKSETNGLQSQGGLLVDFGTIAPGDASVARWIMSCSMSGRFTGFNASFTHGDELGGEMTSLIENANTHILVRDTLVDLPGRDNIRDYLAKNGTLYTIYESDNLEANVKEMSNTAVFELLDSGSEEARYQLTITPETGFVYIRVQDPFNGARPLKQVHRSDGKIICPENAWLSKIQDRETHQWEHFVNLFDASTPGIYTLYFSGTSAPSQKPVLQFIPDQKILEQNTLSFIVQASVPDGSIPQIRSNSLPVGAVLTDQQNGSAVFEWTPVTGQKGIYHISVTAADRRLASSQSVAITVYDADDSDMDGMPDQWELLFFGSLSRDGSGDYDQDGITDLDEYLGQTDPAQDESAPGIPTPVYPHPNIPVPETTPELVVQNGSGDPDNTVEYSFELYSDEGMTQKVAGQDGVSPMANLVETNILNWVADNGATQVPGAMVTTSWPVPAALQDNTRYFWRVRSSGQVGASLWAYCDFFINQANDPPDDFFPASPPDNTQTDTLTPVLRVMNTNDIDFDTMTYTFEVYQDPALSLPVAISSEISRQQGVTTAWTIPSPLIDNTQYFWRAVAKDTTGATTVTPVYSFTPNTQNTAPSAPVITLPPMSAETLEQPLTLTVNNAVDPDNDELSYLFELDTSENFNTSGKQTSGLVSEGENSTSWQVGQLLENTRYFWRVRTSDGQACSQWTHAEFFVNETNEAPPVPVIRNPGNNAWTKTQTPVLSLLKASDPDLDTLVYQFELYADPELINFVAEHNAATPNWSISTPLQNNTTYYWRARAKDEHGVPGAWTLPSAFFIKTDQENIAPFMEIVRPFEDITKADQSLVIQWTDTDADSNAIISLYYDIDNQGADGSLIAGDIQEDPEGDEDTFTWDISALGNGTYYLYSVIADEESSVTAYAPVRIFINRPQESPEPENEEPETGLSLVSQSVLPKGPLELRQERSAGSQATDRQGIKNSQTLPAQVRYLSLEPMDDKTRKKRFTVVLERENQIPLPGVRISLADAQSVFLNKEQVTDINGRAEFDVEQGAYKVWAEYNGYQFWSETEQIAGNKKITLFIPHKEIAVSVVGVYQNTRTPISGCKVFLVTSDGIYSGISGTTDAGGRIDFSLPDKAYRIKASIAGQEIFSRAFQGQDTDLLVPMAEAEIIVYGHWHPLAHAYVYVAAENQPPPEEGLMTDAQGKARFRLPAGPYTFNISYEDQNLVIPLTDLTSDTLNQIPVSLDTGEFRFMVQKGDKDPVIGAKVEVFTQDKTFTGLTGITSTKGNASFDLSSGSYLFRIHCTGQQYWNGPVTIPDVMTATLTLPFYGKKIILGNKNTQIKESRISLFSGSETYLGQYGITDGTGMAEISLLSDPNLLLRADASGHQFWTKLSKTQQESCDPVAFNIGGGTLCVILQKDDLGPIPGARLSLCTPVGVVSGFAVETDPSGKAVFEVPGASYKCRADYMGYRFWSEPSLIRQDTTIYFTIPHADTIVTIEKSFQGIHSPVPGIRTTLYTPHRFHTGRSQTTDENGQACYSLPNRPYVIRIDYMGKTLWTNPSQFTSHNFIIPHGNVNLKIIKPDNRLHGIKINLFSKNGEDLEQTYTTDQEGRVSFEFPSETDFKIRVIADGQAYWSDIASIPADKQNHIQMELD